MPTDPLDPEDARILERAAQLSCKKPPLYEYRISRALSTKHTIQGFVCEEHKNEFHRSTGDKYNYRFIPLGRSDQEVLSCGGTIRLEGLTS